MTASQDYRLLPLLADQVDSSMSGGNRSDWPVWSPE